jgi:hypothetical protein
MESEKVDSQKEINILDDKQAKRIAEAAFVDGISKGMASAYIEKTKRKKNG